MSHEQPSSGSILRKVWNVVRSNYLWWASHLAASAILTRSLSLPLLVVNVLFVHIGSYYIHYYSHVGWPLIRHYDPHYLIHHTDKRHGYLDDLIFEFFGLLAGSFLSIVVPVWWLGWQNTLRPVLIMHGALMYTSIHVINYTLFGSRIHRWHHVAYDGLDASQRRICNLGPDWVDHLFQTSYDGEIENSNEFAINTLCAAFVVMAVVHIMKSLLLFDRVHGQPKPSP